MLPVRCASLLVLLVAAGCLQPGSKPEGHKLFSGRDIGNLGFFSLADETDPNTQVTWVSFNQRQAPAVPPKGAASDLWIASWDGTQQRQIVQNQSSNWGLVGAGGSFFVMVDEQQVASGAAGGQGEWVATLVRIDSHYQANERFENVSSFAVRGYDNRLLYRKVPGGNETPGLFMWDGQDSLRLGDMARAYQFDAHIAASGTAYFVLGSDHVLSRLGSLTDTKQNLHSNVNSFNLRSDEKYAALSLSTGATVMLDLQSGKDMPLALPNPCGGIRFADRDLATYQRCAVAGAPAELHTLDLTTGTNTFVVLPAPLVNLAQSVSRPQSDEVLYLDSQSHGVFLGQNDQKVRRVVPVPMLTPRFSPDGRYLLYVDSRPATKVDPYPHGPLMVQDSDLVNPPRQLSAPGMTLEAVSRPNFFPIDGPSTNGGASYSFVFSAYIVRGSRDLYLVNHETGELKVVARSIGNVSVDSQRIFGTVNESTQDLVGDLVVDDVQDSGGRTVAHAVGEATMWSGLVGYVVRGRVSSDLDGLWGTTLDPPGQDGGH